MNENKVKVGYDKETKSPLYLYKADRLKNTLTLAPIGAGKISQTIIPMLLQDKANNEGITYFSPSLEQMDIIEKMNDTRNVTSFVPELTDSPYFNPLKGDKVDVINILTKTFLALNKEKSVVGLEKDLLSNAITLIKFLYKDNATFYHLYNVIENTEKGKNIFEQFILKKESFNDVFLESTYNYFKNYYLEDSPYFEETFELRLQIKNILDNHTFNRILHPPMDADIIDFEKHLTTNNVLLIRTSHGPLKELGHTLSLMMMFSYLNAVFKQKHTSIHHLYVDELQVYLSEDFIKLLEMSSTYNITTLLSLQYLERVELIDKNFTDKILSNVSNFIIYPGINVKDAEYFSNKFGYVKEENVKTWFSNDGNELTKEVKEIDENESDSFLKPLFTPKDFIYQPFGKMIYAINSNNSLKIPKIGLTLLGESKF